MIVTLIPFFLAARLAVEDNTWRYGPEYIFTVRMNMTKIPQNVGIPFDSHVTSQLHCILKSHNTLSCSLRNMIIRMPSTSTSTPHKSGYEDTDTVNRRRNIVDDPIELLYDEKGISKMTVDRRVHTYGLNILRTIVEQLHIGVDFSDAEIEDTFESVATSTIGRCNVTLRISRHSAENAAGNRYFRLEPLSQLRTEPGTTVVIEKTQHLNNCSCYADGYYGKYGDTIVYSVYPLKVNLENMVSHIEISDSNFVSSTMREGTEESDDGIYNFVETTTIILENIKPAAREPSKIMMPTETMIIANYITQDIPIDQRDRLR